MHNFKNFFNDKKIQILISIFVILSIVHILLASFVLRGAVSDGGLWIPYLMDKFSDGLWFFESATSCRVRFFINFFNQLPINAAHHIFHIDSKYWLSFWYSLPLFLFPFLFPFWHYRLAKRTQRYDLVVFSIALYALFILPSTVYSIVEVYLAASFLFVLFHYLAGKIDYTRIDIIAVVFLIIMLYNTTEAEIYFGIILFFASLFYAKNENNKKNRTVKYLIGINGLISAILIFIWICIVPNIQFFRDTVRFFSEIGPRGYMRNYFVEPVMVLVITLIITTMTFAVRDRFGKGMLSALTVIYALLCVTMFIRQDNYIAHWGAYSYRVYVFIFLPVLALFTLFQDMSKSKLTQNFYYNFLIIICLAGITNTFIQYFYSINFYTFSEKFKTAIETSNEKFLNPDDVFSEETFTDGELLFCECNNFFSQSLLFQDEKVIKKIMTPIKKRMGRCPSVFYVKDGKIFPPYYPLRIKNKFWDMEELMNEAMERSDIMNYDSYTDFSENFDNDPLL